jgi:hypothetical protein
MLLAACLALALAVGGSAAFATEPAAEAAPDAPAQAADAPVDDLEQAAEALAKAKARSAAADAAYSRMRARNWPRGAKREMIVLERSQAHRALLDAVERYEALGGDASEHR